VGAIAGSFAWPFRGPWRGRWAAGLVAVLLLPIMFVPLLGYAIAAVRAAEVDPAHGPPPWRSTRRLWSDGAWTALVLAVSAIPFLVAYRPLAGLFGRTGADGLVAGALAALALLLPWGLVLLLLVPHAVARFALSSDYHDLFDVAASLRGVARDFARWNVVAAAIVTAWAIGLAAAGVLCVGLVPGLYYAILVSAHASATLGAQPAIEDPNLSPR
jgi:Protein of unknown function (DUF4013)